MDPPVGLPAYLAIDPGAVGYGVAAFKSARQRVLVGDGHGLELRAVNAADRAVAPVDSAGDQYELMAAIGQGAGEVASDEAGRSGDGDFHK